MKNLKISETVGFSMLTGFGTDRLKNKDGIHANPSWRQFPMFRLENQ